MRKSLVKELTDAGFKQHILQNASKHLIEEYGENEIFLLTPLVKKYNELSSQKISKEIIKKYVASQLIYFYGYVFDYDITEDLVAPIDDGLDKYSQQDAANIVDLYIEFEKKCTPDMFFFSYRDGGFETCSYKIVDKAFVTAPFLP